MNGIELHDLAREANGYVPPPGIGYTVHVHEGRGKVYLILSNGSIHNRMELTRFIPVYTFKCLDIQAKRLIGLTSFRADLVIGPLCEATSEMTVELSHALIGGR